MDSNSFDMYKENYEAKRNELDLKAYQLIEKVIEIEAPKRLDILSKD